MEGRGGKGGSKRGMKGRREGWNGGDKREEGANQYDLRECVSFRVREQLCVERLCGQALGGVILDRNARRTGVERHGRGD